MDVTGIGSYMLGLAHAYSGWTAGMRRPGAPELLHRTPWRLQQQKRQEKKQKHSKYSTHERRYNYYDQRRATCARQSRGSDRDQLVHARVGSCILKLYTLLQRGAPQVLNTCSTTPRCQTFKIKTNKTQRNTEGSTELSDSCVSCARRSRACTLARLVQLTLARIRHHVTNCVS